MPWDPLPSTFDRARRREAYRRFARLVTGGEAHLIPFDEVKDRIRTFEQSYRGIRPIPVKQIVGTASRRSDFDKDFLPKRREVRERWQRVERAFPEGGFPPIVVNQVGDSYFVVDGHHRVAIARQRKIDYIDAEVTELRTDYQIPEDADIGRIIVAEQEQCFMRDSGLARARPQARIEFALAHRYVELLELIKIHGFHLMRENKRIMEMDEIAGDWYDCVYSPTIAAIREEEIGDSFRHATEADLFLHIWQRRRAMAAERGEITLEGTVRSVGVEEGSRLPVRAKRTARRLGVTPVPPPPQEASPDPDDR